MNACMFWWLFGRGWDRRGECGSTVAARIRFNARRRFGSYKKRRRDRKARSRPHRRRRVKLGGFFFRGDCWKERERLVTRGEKSGDGSWDTLGSLPSHGSLRSAGSDAIYNHKTNDLAILEHGAEQSRAERTPFHSPPLARSLHSDNDGVVGLQRERAASSPECHALRWHRHRRRKGQNRPSKRLERQRGHEPVALSLVPLLPSFLPS